MPVRINTEIPEGGQYIAPILYPYSKLEMINRCLRSIGEVPLPEGTLLDGLVLGTDEETASRVVDETLKEVLSVGWYFNTDYNFKLYRDSEGFIAVPETLLRMDTQGSNQYIVKNGRVYDTYNNTYEFPKEYLEADCVWLVAIDDLPPEAYEYIALRSARKFQEFVITAAELVQVTRDQEMDAYVRLQRRQLQTQAYNIQNARVSTRVSNVYLTRGLYNFKTRR
jgi:hypothetical protein